MFPFVTLLLVNKNFNMRDSKLYFYFQSKICWSSRFSNEKTCKHILWQSQYFSKSFVSWNQYKQVSFHIWSLQLWWFDLFINFDNYCMDNIISNCMEETCCLETLKNFNRFGSILKSTFMIFLYLAAGAIIVQKMAAFPNCLAVSIFPHCTFSPISFSQTQWRAAQFYFGLNYYYYPALL